MRLRFPELKNAANNLKDILDKDFLEGQWGNSPDKKNQLPMLL